MISELRAMSESEINSGESVSMNSKYVNNSPIPRVSIVSRYLSVPPFNGHLEADKLSSLTCLSSGKTF